MSQRGISMSQITLRNLPESVERAIRRRAEERHISLNQSATELLQQALGTNEEGAKYRNLRDLAGTWEEREADDFDRNVEELRSIDPEIWK
ncbi:MAG: FitA-like ribbon-helix-helix domain-containing protein [Spirochaetaceae bacterium]